MNRIVIDRLVFLIRGIFLQNRKQLSLIITELESGKFNKRMNRYLNILVLVMIISSCGQKHNLTGEISGLKNDTLLIGYAPLATFYELDELVMDTLTVTSGKFTYDLTVDEPILSFISEKNGGFTRADGSIYYPQHKYLVLLLKPGEQIKVKGKMHEHYLQYEAEGSDFNREYSELRGGYIVQTSEAVKIELKLDEVMSEKGDQELIKNLFQQRIEKNRVAGAKQLEYIKNNLSKDLSAYFLSQQRLDTLGKYYSKVDVGVKNGIFKHMLDYQHLRYRKYVKVREAEKNIVVGNQAPGFRLKSIDGSDFELNSLKGKYVVLDFWGSWCGWCIKGFPKMKEYYSKYKDKMEIVGVACNDTEEKWKMSVKENGLEWLNVINETDIDKDVAVMYGIKGYPTKIILDKDGKILAKFIGESEEFYQKLDELLTN